MRHYTPVVHGLSARASIAHGAQDGILLHQVDVIAALLIGALKEVCMSQPEGFVRKCQGNLMCRLEQSLHENIWIDRLGISTV